MKTNDDSPCIPVVNVGKFKESTYASFTGWECTAAAVRSLILLSTPELLVSLPTKWSCCSVKQDEWLEDVFALIWGTSRWGGDPDNSVFERRK